MTLHIIEDERQLYKGYRNLLRERSRIAVSISEASDEDKGHIENGLQELLAAEMIKQAHDQLRARGIDDEFLDESDLRSSLSGLPLPERDCRILEAKVRQLARQMMQPQDGNNGGVDGGGSGDGIGRPSHPPAHGTIQQASHTAGHTCICMVSGAPGQTTQSLTQLNPLPAPPPGKNSIAIAIYLLSFVQNAFGGLRESWDALRLIVEPGQPFGIGPNEMLVGLASQVNWAKEIVQWHLCLGRLGSVYQGQLNTTPTYMQLQQGCNGADTIVFRKPGFLGIWYDIANFDYKLFWTVFGGRRLTFTWLAD